MRGHKCSYRVKLTMRLGYVNHWFVEVLGDHDQFANLNDSMYHNSAHSPSIKGSKSSPTVKTPPDSITMDTDIPSPSNTRIPDNVKIETSPLAMMPPGLSVLPTAITSFASPLPNSMMTSQPMTLPINLPNSLPAISQPSIFPSPGSLPMFNISTSGAITAHPEVFGSLALPHLMPPYCQDMPLPLVKIKKEITESSYGDAPMETKQTEMKGIDYDRNSQALNGSHSVSEDQSSNVVQHSPKTATKDGRAKARKKFTPTHVLNPAFKENHQSNFPTQGEFTNPALTDQSGNKVDERNDIESYVRRELREFVARRELDRCLGVGPQTNINGMENGTGENNNTIIAQEGEGGENSYTYLWDSDLPEALSGADKVMDQSDPSTEPQVTRRMVAMTVAMAAWLL